MVVGSIPGQDANKKQPVNVSISGTTNPSLSLLQKNQYKILKMNINKKNVKNEVTQV